MKRAGEIAGMMQGINDVDELESFWDGVTEEVADITSKNAAAGKRLNEIHQQRLALLSGAEVAA